MSGENLIGEILKQRLTSKSEVVDVITFAEAKWGLNITLFHAQKFILKLMHGLALEEHKKTITVYQDNFKEHVRFKLTESDYLRFLKDEGRISPSYEEGEERRETVLAIGRRGSKTRLSSVIIIYNIYKLLSMYNPQAYYGVPESDKIGFAAIATSQDQARELFTPVRAGIHHTSYIDHNLVKGSSDTELKLMSRYDLETQGPKGIPSIQAMAYPCTARGVRGAANMVVVFDEFAHFILTGGNRSDQEVYKAATPAVTSFGDDGKIISISSPLSKSGLFYDLFQQGMGDNPDILAIQAPCWEINEKLSSKILKSEYRKDPDAYLNEFGAHWSGHIIDYIRDPDIFRRNIVREGPSVRGNRRTFYYIGLDLGAVNDSVAICVTHPEGNKVIVDLVEEIEPPRLIAEREGIELSPEEEEIQFDEVAERCSKLCELFNVKRGAYDSWNGYGFGQALSKYGLRTIFEMITYQRSLNSQIYKVLKRLLYENRIEFYPYPKFEEQFLKLQEIKLNKHEIKVEAPGGDTNHDDLADAVVRSVHLCFDDMAADKNPLMAATVDGIVISDFRNPLDQDERPLSSQRQYQLRRKRFGGVNPRYQRLSSQRRRR